MRAPLLALLLALPAMLALPAGAGVTPPLAVQAVIPAFVLPVVQAHVGVPVEWDSLVGVHTVTTADDLLGAVNGVANDPAGADADPDTFDTDLQPTFTHAFTHPGTFYYFCRFHHILGMVGEVQVEA